MTYRDDREALHHRVAQLEQELDDARREGREQGEDAALAHAAELERKVGDMRAELERMELELQAMRGAPPPQRRNVAPIAIACGVLAIAGMGAFFVVRSPARPPPVVVQMPPTEPQARALPAEPTPPAPETAAPALIPVPPPEPPSRSTKARWTATVARAEGLPIAAGSSCTIDATITSKGTNAVVPLLEILCGTRAIYRSSDKLEGMAQMRNDARERLGPSDDKSTFTLLYRDIGSRSGERAQVDLDTTARQGAVFRDTIPRFRVELTIPTTSAPGAPLAGAAERLRRAGKITETSGAAPVKSGAKCVLRAMATGRREDCVAEVACGASILWPSTAPVTCTYVDSRPATVAGNDESASLALDGSTLTLKTKTFGATIALDEP